MKTCCRCGEIKSLDSFCKDKNRSDGLYTYCKECASVYAKKYYESHSEEIKANVRDWHDSQKGNHVEVLTKRCPKCGEIKDASMFDKDDTRITGLRNWCRECRKAKWNENLEDNLIKKRAGYIRNRETNLAYARQYVIENKDVINEKIKIYNSKPEVREKIRTYCKIRRDADPMLRLNNAIRAAIYHSLRGAKNGCHWETLVGFSIDELRGHIEKQFVEGMTWENYGVGGWEIDHKIPLIAHNFSSPDQIDFKRAWHLKNLRPLWATDNRSKSDKLEIPFQPALAIAV